MRNLIFRGNSWEKYEEIRTKDKVIHRNLIKVLREMLRGDPAKGIGKPEPLRHHLSGLWSRRISQKDRVIYRFDEENIEIIALGGHYDDH